MESKKEKDDSNMKEIQSTLRSPNKENERIGKEETGRES